MKYYLSIICIFCSVYCSIAGTSKIVHFKIKEHSKEADSIRMYLNTVHDFCISDSIAKVYYKDNHSDTYTVVSEGENRMFYIINGATGYYVKFNSAFRDVEFIIDNSESRVEAAIIMFEQIQFDCNGSISNCKSSDIVCIESKRRDGCIQR